MLIGYARVSTIDQTLAQAGQILSQIIGEGLCDEPQKKAMRVMLTELRGMLDEFVEVCFDD